MHFAHASALTLFIAAPCAAQLSESQVDALDAVLAPAVGANKTVGLAAGVRLGDTEWWRGYGVTRRGAGGAAPDADTLFEIGSITKVFTGLLLADCVERGSARLDEPVRALLPHGTEFPSTEPPIRLVDLVTHRSGLPRMPNNVRPGAHADSGPFADYGQDALFEFLADFRPRRAPGLRYEYSNLASGLLGHALACRAGQPYDALLRERVLLPLGLTNSYIQTTGGKPPAPDLVADVHNGVGHRIEPWSFDALAAGGAMRSSVHDLLRFVDANLDLADLGSDRERWQRILATARRVHANAGGPPVGLGWHYRGADRGIVWHNGGTGGSSSHLAIDVERRIGVVVLSNSVRSIDAVALKLFDVVGSFAR